MAAEAEAATAGNPASKALMDANVEDRPINRCICYDRTFLELKQSGLESLEAIRATTGCTSGCGMCAKYIELMLATGDTEFPILWGPEFRRYVLDHQSELTGQKESDSL